MIKSLQCSVDWDQEAIISTSVQESYDPLNRPIERHEDFYIKTKEDKLVYWGTFNHQRWED